jgi:hypothetical protein
MSGDLPPLAPRRRGRRCPRPSRVVEGRMPDLPHRHWARPFGRPVVRPASVDFTSQRRVLQATNGSAPVRYVCSVCARQSQHPLPLADTERHSDSSELGQNTTVWHCIISGNTDNRGLLIRGFGVRVPGGAPGLTCMFFSFDLGFGYPSPTAGAMVGNGTGTSRRGAVASSAVSAAAAGLFRGTSCAEASAAARATSGRTEVYVSAVMVMLLCSRSSWTILRSAPVASVSVAAP